MMLGVSREDASEISQVKGVGRGLEGEGGGIFYPTAGIVRPLSLCRLLRFGPGEYTFGPAPVLVIVLDSHVGKIVQCNYRCNYE